MRSQYFLRSWTRQRGQKTNCEVYGNRVICLFIGCKGAVELQRPLWQAFGPESLQVIPCHGKNGASVLAVALLGLRAIKPAFGVRTKSNFVAD